MICQVYFLGFLISSQEIESCFTEDSITILPVVCSAVDDVVFSFDDDGTVFSFDDDGTVFPFDDDGVVFPFDDDGVAFPLVGDCVPAVELLADVLLEVDGFDVTM